MSPYFAGRLLPVPPVLWCFPTCLAAAHGVESCDSDLSKNGVVPVFGGYMESNMMKYPGRLHRLIRPSLSSLFAAASRCGPRLLHLFLASCDIRHAQGPLARWHAYSSREASRKMFLQHGEVLHWICPGRDLCGPAYG